MTVIPCRQRKSLFRRTLIAISLAFMVAHPASAYEAVVAQAQQALANGDNQAAFEQLQEAELEYSGIPAFDYWLGVAALRTGQPSYALIALDRVIYRQPGHAGARLERVAALLQLDQRGAAGRELERLRGLSPPAEAEAAIARYQAAINERRDLDSAPQHQGRLSIDVGFDGNPQRFPNEITINPLDSDERESLENRFPIDTSEFDQVLSSEGSAHRRLRGSYGGVFPYSDTTRFRVAAVGQSQRYVERGAEDFDLSLAQIQLGLERDLAAERVLTLNATALQGWRGRDFDTFLTRWGGNAELRHPVGLDDELAWRFGAESNHFEAGESDYDAAHLGLQWSGTRGPWRNRLSTRVKREWAQGARDGADMVELRVAAGLGYTITPRQRLRLDLNQRLGNYDQDGFALYNDHASVRRQDRTSQAELSWVYALTQDWVLKAKAGFERRRSNIRFFDMRREQVEIGLRYGF